MMEQERRRRRRRRRSVLEAGGGRTGLRCAHCPLPTARCGGPPQSQALARSHRIKMETRNGTGKVELVVYPYSTVLYRKVDRHKQKQVLADGRTSGALVLKGPMALQTMQEQEWPMMV
jgi:hypothetical protein